MTEHTTKFM